MAFQLDRELARLLVFDEHDLAANRSGVLSQDQQIMFGHASGTGRGRTGQVLLAIVMLVVIGGALVLAAHGSLPWTAVVVVVGALSVPAVASVLLSRSGAKRQRAWAHPVVRSVEGHAEVTSTMSEETRSLRVGHQRFAIHSADTYAFRPERLYRIHYLDSEAGAPVILSVEVDARMSHPSWKFSQ